jgi:pimeloyl-ACP methyl ester carboxylesterase
MNSIRTAVLLCLVVVGMVYAIDMPPQSTEWYKGQSLDHFDALNQATWSQRYFVIDKYYRVGGPVILHICGEYTCEGVFPFRLWPVELAQKFGALIVTPEHRFFGASQPFDDLSVEHLAFLNTQQALADLAQFSDWYQEEMINAKYNITGRSKWFVVGGSYPGALSAWYRLKYPHLSVGALSSSGVVHAILEYGEFDQQVARSAALSGPDCVSGLQGATLEVEQRMPAIKAAFGAQDLLDDDFLYLVADSAAEGIQYGHREELCNQMIAAVREGQSLADQLANYTTKFFYPVMGNSASEYNSTAMADPNVDPLAGSRQWWWMKCSELAYFQVAPKVNSIRSTQIDLAWHQRFCARVFPEFTTFPPNTHAVNVQYGGNMTDGTNILFVNGVEDPWQTASVPGPTVAPLPSSSEQSTIVDCAQCAHCVDLYTPTPQDAPSLQATRQNTLDHLKQWLA